MDKSYRAENERHNAFDVANGRDCQKHGVIIQQNSSWPYKTSIIQHVLAQYIFNWPLAHLNTCLNAILWVELKCVYAIKKRQKTLTGFTIHNF